MAVTPETPDTNPTGDAPPPPRRAPRKAKPADAAPKRTPARRAPKASQDNAVLVSATKAVHAVEEQAADAVKTTRRVAGRTAKTVEDAVVGTARKAGRATGVVKPRSSKRSTTTAAKGGRKSAARSASARATQTAGSRWGIAALATGVVAAAGAAAALLTLKGSTPKGLGSKGSAPKTSGSDGLSPKAPALEGKPAHGAKQADGTDASGSFEAGIADEGSIPNA